MKQYDLCEHLTRPARNHLVELLLDKLGSKERLAAEVGVTERAVRKWVLCLTHPSNIHLQKMLELVFQLDEQRACEIIEQDLMNFSDAIKLTFRQHLRNTVGEIASLTS